MLTGNWFCHGVGWAGTPGLGIWGWATIAAEAMFGLAVLAGIVALLIWTVRRATAVPATARSAPTALEALQMEYARGLISSAQYHERRAALRGRSV